MIATKWPRLLVVGESVTPDQAAEIIARTTRWQMLFTNNKAWERQIHDCLTEIGYPRNPRWNGTPEERIAWWRTAVEWEAAHGVLSLSYLETDRVASAWVHGAHGWVDWDGSVWTGGYNIGKWPSDDEVTEDWTAIAEAFPYLKLTAQVVDEEGDGELAAQWTVRDGHVEYDGAPTARVMPVPPFGTSGGSSALHFADPFREVGCTLDQLRHALSFLARPKGGETE